MRTTLSIDDELLDAVRRRAAESRLSLGEVVNQALRRGLAEEAHDEVTQSFSTITFGDPGSAFPSFEVLRAAERDLEEAYLGAKLGHGDPENEP